MTIAICTISPTRAWLSSDSWIQRIATGGSESDLRAACQRVYEAFGTPGLPVIDEAGDWTTGRKVLLFERQRFAAVVSGSIGLAFEFGLAAREAKGIDGVAEGLPDFWRQSEYRVAGGSVVVAGWSEQQQRIIGYKASGQDGMNAHALADGTTWQPEPPADYPSARRVRQLLDSGDPIALHVEAASAMAWGSAMARYTHKVGGKLTTATIIESGITLSDTADLGLPQVIWRRPSPTAPTS